MVVDCDTAIKIYQKYTMGGSKWDVLRKVVWKQVSKGFCKNVSKAIKVFSNEIS